MPSRLAQINALYDAFPELLKRSGRQCTLIDSRSFLKPEQSQHDHFYGKPATDWGQSVFDKILGASESSQGGVWQRVHVSKPQLVELPGQVQGALRKVRGFETKVADDGSVVLPPFFAGFQGSSAPSSQSAAQRPSLDSQGVPSPLSIDASDRTRYAKVSQYLKSQGASQSVIDMTISEAVRQKVDPLLALAIVKNESDFKAHVTSAVGARGLMQVMPDTGRSLGVSNPKNLYDAQTNLRAGLKHLKGLWAKFTDLSFTALATINPFADNGVKNAIAAYNAGPGAVEKAGGVPHYRETQGYVQKVLSTYLDLRGLFGSED
jgi:hypothetical protein